MPNSMDFYKGTFLHVIPVLSIVPYYFEEHLRTTASIFSMYLSSNVFKSTATGARKISFLKSLEIFTAKIFPVKTHFSRPSKLSALTVKRINSPSFLWKFAKLALLHKKV